MAGTPVRVLIINPNTSTHMTDALKPVVESLGYESVEYTFFTSPTPGIPSINSPEDAAASASTCFPHLVPLLAQHDVFLVACYSQHPLVSWLKSECNKLSREATRGTGGRGVRKYVTGIFEASVMASLSLISTGQTGSAPAESTVSEPEPGPREVFGIVSTGKVWESALYTAVAALVGTNPDPFAWATGGCHSFVGCQTTGLNASELHDLDPVVVNEKMKSATKRLFQDAKQKNSRLTAICLGCAGMVGLEQAVRSAAVEELGEDGAKNVAIVDGVKAGVGQLIALARCGF